jgi:hypothetical protein
MKVTLVAQKTSISGSLLPRPAMAWIDFNLNLL